MPACLTEFLMRSIGMMSATALRQSVVRPSDKPKEAVYQHLFMQAMHACSPASIMICPELSRVFPDESSDDGIITGELDFYLNGSLRWGIELLVGGVGVGEHIHRFADDGKYAKLKVKDYAVVDFRRSGVSSVQKHDKRVTVFFNDTFEECTVIVGNASSLTLRLAT